MSVLQAIREKYVAQLAAQQEFDTVVLAKIRRGGKSHGSGNPTGSAVGKCTAQLQQLRYAEKMDLKPEPFSMRSKMVMETGDLVEAWWGAAIELAFPNLSGRNNELFYFPVPLDKSDVTALLKRAPEAFKKRQPGQWWGEVSVGEFKPPAVVMTDKGPVLRNKIERDDRTVKARKAALGALPVGMYEIARKHALEMKIPIANLDAALGIPVEKPRPLGFVLSPVEGVIWVPTYVDRLLNHSEHGVVTLEKKAVSNFAFRRAVIGEVDFEKRCQMVTFVEATKLPVAWLFFRKETAHLLEIFFAPDNDKVKVTFTKSNGQQETFVRHGSSLKREDGTSIEMDAYPESEWDVAETWTPYDKDLLGQIHDNVRRVLLAEEGQWHRRYGPSFICRVCNGTKIQTLSKSTKEPLKKAKPCEDCGQTGVVERVELPRFPCGYCPVVKNCYGAAGLETEITDKPKHFVTREAYMAAGLSFTPFGKDIQQQPDEPLI